MSPFVLDASVTMAWCFEDEGDDDATKALDSLITAPALVPSLWRLEVVNTLLVAERRGRLSEAASVRFLELLAGLPIVVDAGEAAAPLAGVIDLARAHDLSAYDAAYLELAMRAGLPLATRDNRLGHAAQAAGVALL